MIQFNLLPDVKLEYIKAERTKRLAISISVLASGVALVILVLLLSTVLGVQKKNLNDLNKDITANSQKLKNSPNLNKVLTVQNQLTTLSGLHEKKPAASRFYGYLSQITPSNITVSNATIDFTQDTVSITGNSQSLDNVNTFIDTLKFTTFSADGEPGSPKAFSSVVLSAFSRTSAAPGSVTTASVPLASYTITFSFDPTIADITKKVTLTVPQTVTTRSVTEQPGALFKKVETK